MRFFANSPQHWYAAEEVGLRGSLDISNAYRSQMRPIVGMMQLDMTGYVPSAQAPLGTIGVLTDFTDPELADFLRMLIDTYSALARIDFKCGYACSDHASWVRKFFLIGGGYISLTDFILEPRWIPFSACST